MRCETARRRPPRLRAAAAASDPDTDNPDPGPRERSCRHPREKSHRIVGDHDDDDGAQPRDQLDLPRLVHVRPAQPLRTGKKTPARVTKRAFLRTLGEGRGRVRARARARAPEFDGCLQQMWFLVFWVAGQEC